MPPGTTSSSCHCPGAAAGTGVVTASGSEGSALIAAGWVQAMSHCGRRQRHAWLQTPSHQLPLGFGVVHAAAIALAAADQVGNQIDGVLCHGVHLPSWWTPSSALNLWSARRPQNDAYVHPFTRTSEPVQRLQVARRELAHESAISRLERFDLLILDDITCVSKDQAETSVLFELICAL